MNIKHTLCAIAACGAAAVATAAGEVAEAEKGEVEETPVVSGEAGLSFDSKYMTYGVVDGKDPILTPCARLAFFDWAYVGVESIFDLTKGNGKRGEYGNRAAKWTTLDAIVGLSHEFELSDGIGLSVDFNYIYEYLRRHRYHNTSGEDKDMGDTQYLNLELGLTGMWIEPTLAIERDLMADDGTYINLELAHSFALVGDDEDPTLTFTPSVAQGFGDKHRTRGYDLAADHGGVMDTTIKGEFEWAVCDHVSLTAYIAYSDYWFDSKLRDGARAYNGAWGKGSDHTWNVYGGVGVTVSF